VWRDPKTTLRATKRLIAIARETCARVHVLQITTAEEIRFLALHKGIASVEVTPQHLTLVAPDCYAEMGTRAQMNPLIREISHREGLWWGLDQGAVDVIGSDHAPHTLVDLAAKWRILDQEMANQSGWTLFHDSDVTGCPTATIIRGLVAMREGDLAA
jgi:dihydroorotase